MPAALSPRPLNLNLSAQDVAYWSQGVPEQQSSHKKMPIWEQAAYTYEFIRSDTARTISMEFDYMDIHGQRSEQAMAVMTKQTVLPLVRLIEKLKSDGLWHRTVIQINTLDGSRPPNADSYGNSGRNGFMLAGGAIQGGYYGDVRYQKDGGYSYHMPDLKSGLAIPNGSRNNEKRVPDAAVYKTTLKALGLCAQANDIADTNGVSPLDFMLKG